MRGSVLSESSESESNNTYYFSIPKFTQFPFMDLSYLIFQGKTQNITEVNLEESTRNMTGT